MAWKSPQNVGDHDASVIAAKVKLAKYKYGAGLGNTDEYTAEFGVALREYQTRVHADVLAKKRPAPDVAVNGVLDWATKTQLELIPRASNPTAPKKRHRFYVWRGTGGVIGQDPVSLVCQGAGDLVEEINPPWAATMGGIPVGTAGGIGDPSMWAAVQATVTWTQNDIIGYLSANPKAKIGFGGYSAGAIAMAIVKDWLLRNYPDNYLCSFSLGDPTRPKGGGFFGRPAAWGRGISTVQYGDPKDYRHCWLAHEDDMYTQVPGGVAGDIMDDVYEEVTQFSFSDIMQVAMRMLPVIPKVAAKAGISLPAALTSLAGGPVGLFGFGLTTMLGMLPGIIGGGDPDALTGQQAAGKAIMIAVKFLFAGTGPHIRYHMDEAWPGGPTFVQLGTMHVRDYATRTPAV